MKKASYIKKFSLLILSLFIVVLSFTFSIQSTKALEETATMQFFLNNLYSVLAFESEDSENPILNQLPNHIVYDYVYPYHFVQESAFFRKINTRGYQIYSYTEDGTSKLYGYNTTYYKPVQGGAINTHNNDYRLKDTNITSYVLQRNLNSDRVPLYDYDTNKETFALKTTLTPPANSSSYAYLGGSNTAQYMYRMNSIYDSNNNNTNQYDYSSYNWDATKLEIEIGKGAVSPGSVMLFQLRYDKTSSTSSEPSNIQIVFEQKRADYRKKIYTIGFKDSVILDNTHLLSILLYIPNDVVLYPSYSYSSFTFYITGLSIGNFNADRCNLWTSYGTTPEQIINLYEWLGNEFVDDPSGGYTPPGSGGGGSSVGGSCNYNQESLFNFLTEKFDSVIQAIGEIDVSQDTVNNINNIYNETNNTTINNYLPDVDEWEFPTLDINHPLENFHTGITNITNNASSINSSIITPIWNNIIVPMHLDYVIYISSLFIVFIAIRGLFR